MKKLIERRYLVRQNLIAIIGLSLSLYFAYHLLAGERSYWRMTTLEQQISSVGADLEATRAQREALEKRVVMLRPGSIDRDLLEERARAVLGYGRDSETIVVSPPA